jgi:hypothetical protein
MNKVRTTVCLVVVIVVGGQVSYNVKNVYFSVSYIKCGSAISVRENYTLSIPGSQLQAQQASINLIKEITLLSHFWARNLLKEMLCAYYRESG